MTPQRLHAKPNLKNDIKRSSEDTVRPPWRHGERDKEVSPSVIKPSVTNVSVIPCLVSLDVHEWRNDWGAVSRNSPVKMRWRSKRRLPAAGKKDPVELYYSFTLKSRLSCIA